MKALSKYKSLSFKLWFTIISSIILSVVFAYSLSQYFYKNLYVEKVKKDLINESSLLAADYSGGQITDEFKQKVDWFNSKNESEIFVVNNPRELSACLPFDVDYQTLISEEERQMLLEGKTIEKDGYEPRFGKKIVAAIIPLLDENRLEGIIYTYIPVDSITDIIQEFAVKWMIAAILFLIIAILLTTKWLKKLIHPIQEMEVAARQVSKGDYSIQVPVTSHDEVGQLAKAFNEMAKSIHLEEEKKREFLENVSHELRTPLSYVKGYTQAILDGVISDQQGETKYLQLISRETLRMQQLVSDLMELTRMEGNQVPLQTSPMAFAQFIEDFAVKYEQILSEKKLKLQLQLNPDPIIMADERKMEQILQNIFDNAIQYTDANGSISVILEQYKDTCRLTIADTGCGIPEQDLPHIMNRFYRVNKARSRSNGGSGLGLSIVKKLVTLQNGEITIESKAEKGTKVILVFPIVI